MFRFKSSNDPDYPGEKIVGAKDVVLLLAIVLSILSGIVSVYALIWAAWTVFRVAATILVTVVLAAVAFILIPKKEDTEL